MSNISASVGKGGANRSGDVVTVQTLLNENIRKIGPLAPLKVDGKFGPRTLAAIEAFQARVVGMARPDGRVDPKGPTFKALLNCGCNAPEENYPYSEDTFSVIARLADLIKAYSLRFGVSPIAVAGSIADEYNTQKGVKGIIDWFQDEILINYMPNFAIRFDAWLGINSKLLNATKHDLGKGNIKLETAKQIFDQFKDSFDQENMTYADLVDYIRSDKGTVHIAALVIKKATEDLGDLTKGYSEEKSEAVQVTYYKQGPSYISRFKEALAKDPARRLEAGEGCRVILQRERFKLALGLE